MEYRCVHNAETAMGEFHTMVDWNPPQGSEKDGGGRVNIISKRVRYANISMRDESLILRDLRHSFSLLW